MKKTGFASIFLVLGALVIIVICLLFIPALTSKSTIPNTSNTNAPKNKVVENTHKFDNYVLNNFTPPTFTDNSPKNIVESLVASINKASPTLKLSPVQNGSVWWIADDNSNILDPNAFSSSLKVVSLASCGAGSFTCAETPVPQTLNSVIKKTFEQNGFSLNTLNSSKDEKDTSLYDYVLAYQKGETRCTMTTLNDQMIDNYDHTKQDNPAYFTYTISCSDQFQKAYAQQSPMINDLGTNAKNAIVTVKKQVGNYANVDIHFRRTGMFAIIKLENGHWKLIFRGQNYPNCKLMTDNSVPQEVYDQCYNN